MEPGTFAPSSWETSFGGGMSLPPPRASRRRNPFASPDQFADQVARRISSQLQPHAAGQPEEEDEEAHGFFAGPALASYMAGARGANRSATPTAEATPEALPTPSAPATPTALPTPTAAATPTALDSGFYGTGRYGQRGDEEGRSASSSYTPGAFRGVGGMRSPAFQAGIAETTQVMDYLAGRAKALTPRTEISPEMRAEGRARAVSTAGTRLPVGERLDDASVPGAGVYADPFRPGRKILSQERRTPAMEAAGTPNPSPLARPGLVTMRAQERLAAPSQDDPAGTPGSAASLTQPEPRRPATINPFSGSNAESSGLGDTFRDFGAAGVIGRGLASVARGAGSAGSMAPAALEGAAEGLIGRRGVAGVKNVFRQAGQYDDLGRPAEYAPKAGSLGLPSAEAVAASPGMATDTGLRGAMAAPVTPAVRDAFKPRPRPTGMESYTYLPSSGKPVPAWAQPRRSGRFQAAADRFNPFAATRRRFGINPVSE